ncbi:hypothetical protein AVEN_154188-1 [Araneus ventricosus]|uniref:Secreted protein n=1 Tax=Araneus ventricosus TaxID=182803 RepID=A0A4Y2TSF4_ARAVE|nr:hypothetical protein AVEN_154188-1 [Araneus ventricosus]
MGLTLRLLYITTLLHSLLASSFTHYPKSFQMLTQKSDGRKSKKNEKENLAGNSTAVRTPPACRSRTHLVEDSSWSSSPSNTTLHQDFAGHLSR